MDIPIRNNSVLYDSIREVVNSARRNVYRAVNFAMVEAYWNIGRLIVEEEQQGDSRAEYGKHLLEDLSQRLTDEFGKGFSVESLKQFRKFYLTFPKGSISDEISEEQKGYTLCTQLSWSHYRLIMRVENPTAREYYMHETAAQNWSVRALQRQINSLYYERLLSSRHTQSVKDEADVNTQKLALKPEDVLKDPYILEFLQLKNRPEYTESDLESSLLDELQTFLLELGSGFSFVARQKHFDLNGDHFYIDLVFYHYKLKCFVLIDLKRGKLTHQDIGQMDTYIRIFEDKVRGEDDNPTIGLILCSDKNEAVAKYSVLADGEQIFASRYQLFLPKVEELEAVLMK